MRDFKNWENLQAQKKGDGQRLDVAVLIYALYFQERFEMNKWVAKSFF